MITKTNVHTEARRAGVGRGGGGALADYLRDSVLGGRMQPNDRAWFVPALTVRAKEITGVTLAYIQNRSLPLSRTRMGRGREQRGRCATRHLRRAHLVQMRAGGRTTAHCYDRDMRLNVQACFHHVADCHVRGIVPLRSMGSSRH